MAEVVQTARSEGIRRAALRVVKTLWRVIDSFLIVVMIAVAVQVLPAFAPGLEKVAAFKKVRALLEPTYAVVRANVPHSFGKKGEETDLTGLIVFVAVLFSRNAVNWRVDKLSLNEMRRREIKARSESRAVGEDPEEAKRRQQAARKVAVGQYTEAKAMLEAAKQDLTFVSLDIAGSTTMKAGEDPFVIEHAFVEYRKLVERIIGRHNVYKAAWTPDGQMFAFRSPDGAVKASIETLSALPKFNKEVSKMKQPFRLRAGANCGIVSTDDATPMEQVSDESIDVAGHLQKHCDPGDLWISKELFDRLTDKLGFEPNGKNVDGRAVYVWRPAPPSVS